MTKSSLAWRAVALLACSAIFSGSVALAPTAQAQLGKCQAYLAKGFEYRDDPRACRLRGIKRITTGYWPIEIVQFRQDSADLDVREQCALDSHRPAREPDIERISKTATGIQGQFTLTDPNNGVGGHSKERGSGG